MRKMIRIIALGATVPVLLYSCKKKDNNSTVGYASVESVFSALAIQAKLITINVAADTSIYGASGTRYTFRANSFQTATGAPVTGQVQLQLTEYLKEGDMIFSKMLPISSGAPLLSGGELNVVATQDGSIVYLKPGYTFSANVPQTGAVPADIQLFSGVATEDTSQNKVNWIKRDNDSLGIGVTVVGADTLSIISDSLRLVNADAFMASPSFQTFTVTVTANGTAVPSGATVYGYTLYDTYKGVWPLAYLTGGYSLGTFSENHVPNIPVHFAVFTVISGIFYGGTLASTPTTGSNYSINLTAIDATAFKNQLNAR